MSPTREVTHLALQHDDTSSDEPERRILYGHLKKSYPTSRVVDTSSNPQSVEHDQESSLPTSVFALLGSPSTTQDTTCPLGSIPKLLTDLGAANQASDMRDCARVELGGRTSLLETWDMQPCRSLLEASVESSVRVSAK
jgi:hypothetical protein